MASPMATMPNAMNNFCTRHTDTYPFISPAKSNLQGKHVLITGASRGVGKAMALSYAKAGASGIALAARSDLSTVTQEVLQAAKQSNRTPPKVLTVKLDTTSESDTQAAAEKVKREFGKLDILINNAGYLEEWLPVADSKPSEWWKTFEVNVKGPYLMSRAFIPLLLASPDGDKTIVQITSAGALATAKGASAYQTSKTAGIRFNNFLTAEYAEQGLLAYAVHPGGVKTELAMNMPEHMYGILVDTPELCGDSIVWLTRERREWLADRVVYVNWEMEELDGKRERIVKEDLLKFKMMC